MFGPTPATTRRRRALLGAMLAMPLTAAAACGSDADPAISVEGDTVDDSDAATDTVVSGDDAAPEGDDATGVEGDAVDTTALPPPESQRYGGSLVFGTFGEVSGFDTVKPGLAGCNNALYDTLLRFGDNGEVEPYLAESFSSDDNVIWTLTLRDGVQFHDGTPLDAAAVVYNVERHRNPEISSPHAGDAAPIESVVAVDPLEVEFTLSEPLSVFATAFAQGYGLGTMLSPAALEQLGDDYSSGPVGAGPFEFVEWLPDDRLILQRNDNYWQESLPYLDELICRPLPDAFTRYQAVAAGDVDLAYLLSAAEIVDAEANDDLVVAKSDANGGEGIMLNANRPPFDDPRMRAAFVHLLNRDAIAEVRFDGQRDRTGVTGLVASDDPLYNEEVDDVWPSFDPAAAAELIESYRADGGDPNFDFVFPEGADRRVYGAMFEQFYAPAGLDVSVQFLDIAEYVQTVLQGGDFQAAITSYPAFVGMYPVMWDAYHTDGSSNFGSFSNAEVDALLETAVSSNDPAVVEQAWRDVQLAVAELIPLAVYGRPPSAIVTQQGVAGVDRYPDNTLFFATLSAEE